MLSTATGRYRRDGDRLLRSTEWMEKKQRKQVGTWGIPA